MFRKCCCGSSSSSCSDTCSCVVGLQQINIQVAFFPEVCSYQTGTQATHVPIECSGAIGGAVDDDELYTAYGQSLTGCRWGKIYNIQSLEILHGVEGLYYCPVNCNGACTETDPPHAFPCCHNNPNGGVCNTFSGDCFTFTCDCDADCCAQLHPPGPDRVQCNLDCFEQIWQRYCASGKWKTTIVGQGLFADRMKTPPTVEYRFAVDRYVSRAGVRTYADGLTFYGSGSPLVTSGYQEMPGGKRLRFGNYSCPTGETCINWGVSDTCYTETNETWFGYPKKTGKSYVTVVGYFPVESERVLLESPQGGSSNCYTMQGATPAKTVHDYYFKMLYEGTSSGNSVTYQMVNSVSGPEQLGSGSIPLACGTGKCPGMTVSPGPEGVPYGQIGKIFGSGFTV
jgi:hypothetical protein